VLPFVPERRVVDACLVIGPEEAWYQEYARRVEQILAALVKGLAPRPSTSCSVTCSSPAGGADGERDLHLGQAYGVSPQALPATAQFVALATCTGPGDHRGVEDALRGIADRARLREREQDKRVVVFEARPAAGHGRVGAGEGRPKADRGGRTLEELRAMAGELGDSYLRVTARTDSPSPAWPIK